MFLIGEIGGRRQRARVSSPRMNAAGRRTTYVRRIPGLQQHGWVGDPRPRRARPAGVSQKPRGPRQRGSGQGSHGAMHGPPRGSRHPAHALRRPGGSEVVTLAQGPATTQLGPPPVTRSNDCSRKTRNRIWM